VTSLRNNSKTRLKLRNLKYLSCLEKSVDTANNRFKNVSGQIKKRKDNLGNFQYQTTQDLLAKEIYAKRFNIPVHGKKKTKTMSGKQNENPNSKWLKTVKT